MAMQDGDTYSPGQPCSAQVPHMCMKRRAEGMASAVQAYRGIVRRHPKRRSALTQ